MFERIMALFRMLGGTVARGLRATEPAASHTALCLAWPAVYSRSWVYWWRLVILLLLLALIEAISMVASLSS